jgi:hypothetical protein
MTLAARTIRLTRIVSILCVALPAFAQRPQCPQALLAMQPVFNATTTIVAGPEQFASVPKWDLDHGEPPLSIGKAVSAARASLQGDASSGNKISIYRVGIFPVPCREMEGHWYYRVDYSQTNQATPLAPFSPKVAVVLMDGSVMLPSGTDSTDARMGSVPMSPEPSSPPHALAIDSSLPKIWYDGLLSADVLGSQAKTLFAAGDYKQLDAELTRVRESRERLPDGRSLFALSMSGLARALSIDEKWDAVFESITQWRKAAPNSSNAAILEAAMWSQYAWYARGTGKWNSVSDTARQLYNERLAKARRVLEESKQFASGNSYWYVVMIETATGEGWPIDRQMALFDEAVQRDPLFLQTYFAMGKRLTPRWGGDIALYNKLTEKAVSQTKSTEGQSMYARMYWYYAGIENDQPFRELGIPWPLMKAGFEDLIARYPSSWNLNSYARFACEANDKSTFLQLAPRLTGENLRADAWPSGYKFETCKDAFMSRT